MEVLWALTTKIYLLQETMTSPRHHCLCAVRQLRSNQVHAICHPLLARRALQLLSTIRQNESWSLLLTRHSLQQLSFFHLRHGLKLNPLRPRIQKRVYIWYLPLQNHQRARPKTLAYRMSHVSIGDRLMSRRAATKLRRDMNQDDLMFAETWSAPPERSLAVGTPWMASSY